jgi:8-oxo-dGTP diphosphatase
MPSIDPDTSKNRQAVHVAVGIVQDRKGRVLLAQRPAGGHQGGKWEFPGGKVAAGEGVRAALVRELREELGIITTAAYPLLRTAHHYAERDVLLDVWRIVHYVGEAYGREGQSVRWMPLHALPACDLPEADRPILRALDLPSLYLVSAAGYLGVEPFLAQLEQLLRAGLRLLQLREKQLSDPEFLHLARRTVALCHRYGAKVLVNAAPDVVAACGADGVHLNSVRLRAARMRPLSHDLLVAASCHDAAELRAARDLGVDLVVLSPVQATASHPDATPLGWKGLQEMSEIVGAPVYALGGMRADDLARARDHGAHGLAMISGVWNVQNPATVVQTICGNP